MAVGQDQAIRRDDDPGAEPAARRCASSSGAGLDADHRGPHALGHADDRI